MGYFLSAVELLSGSARTVGIRIPKVPTVDKKVAYLDQFAIIPFVWRIQNANSVTLGSVTLAAVVAIFGFDIWFEKLHGAQPRSALRIVFMGSASGLRKGGSVNFNGVRVGELTSVTLDNPRRVVVLATLENNAPIRKDTHVGLQFQGLTGAAAVSLKGGEDAAPPVSLDDDGVPTLPADPNALQDVTEAIRGTLQNMSDGRL